MQLGVDAVRLKRRVFVAAALLTGSVVAFTGPIGFVGLVVPHLLRGILGQDNRLLVPHGAGGRRHLPARADTLARNIVAPAELSVGVITSFCGAPFFVYLLRTRVPGQPLMAPLVEFAGVGFGYPRPERQPRGRLQRHRRLVRDRGRRDLRRDRPEQRRQDDAAPPAHASAGGRRAARSGSAGRADRADARTPSWPGQVAVVPQAPRPFPFTVEQLVLMGRYPHGPGRYFENDEDRALARAAMAATGVLDLAGLPLEQLAGGERQRAMLARALAQQPRLLVLDEPTSHLDLRYQVQTAELLRRVNAEHGHHRAARLPRSQSGRRGVRPPAPARRRPRRLRGRSGDRARAELLEPVFRCPRGRGSKSGERPTARACHLAVSARRREREVQRRAFDGSGSRSKGSR